MRYHGTGVDSSVRGESVSTNIAHVNPCFFLNRYTVFSFIIFINQYCMSYAMISDVFVFVYCRLTSSSFFVKKKTIFVLCMLRQQHLCLLWWCCHYRQSSALKVLSPKGPGLPSSVVYYFMFCLFYIYKYFNQLCVSSIDSIKINLYGILIFIMVYFMSKEIHCTLIQFTYILYIHLIY